MNLDPLIKKISVPHLYNVIWQQEKGDTPIKREDLIFLFSSGFKRPQKTVEEMIPSSEEYISYFTMGIYTYDVARTRLEMTKDIAKMHGLPFAFKIQRMERSGDE